MARLRSLLDHPRAPLVLLAVLSVVSLGVRAAALGDPCRSPCNTATDHTTVFDEAYYVNAARVIAGIEPPPGANYAASPPGDDPNSEHPQGAKLIIAGAIELFGDGPFAWRIGSLVFGSIALLGLYALVRAAGGRPWLALGACALMASDNLLIVHGRIGTLDIYVLAPMLWAAVAYLRGRPILAGALVGIGSCFKLVAPYLLLALAVFELLRWLAQRTDAARRLWSLGASVVSSVVVFLPLLWLMDTIAPPYDPGAAKVITGGPFAHLAHMFSYQTGLTSPHGPMGIASYPWEWLVDFKPITYLAINPAHPSGSLFDIYPATHFLGMISPPIMLLAVPALVVAGVEAARLAAGGGTGRDCELGLLGLSWFIGTWLPFELLSAIYSRTSYLYYMVIVMPGIYISIVYLLARLRVNWKLVAVWAFAVLVAAVVMYPFTPWP